MYQRLALLLLVPLAGCVSAGSADVTRELSVGQTGHITAYRADRCGAEPPSFAALAPRLPRSELVTYSDGGLSSRVSNECGTRVPTRAVNGTGVKAGSEVKRFQSGTVAIVVK
ncbi:hypothetical protein FY036_22725 [Mesorhizobium microcysteis]|uniref:Lipoprotein n=1 Tax=Neoaquamicrobium microcysteis TaxID=2682781 RepID=A0A5D4GNY1_9HYPH|nr:hypothetical protein [Mesorhizobium microcysteis]TYR29663.1 hypothetical protein FY036_22725 [Mesorhizobium microcysteis]